MSNLLILKSYSNIKRLLVVSFFLLTFIESASQTFVADTSKNSKTYNFTVGCDYFCNDKKQLYFNIMKIDTSFYLVTRLSFNGKLKEPNLKGTKFYFKLKRNMSVSLTSGVSSGPRYINLGLMDTITRRPNLSDNPMPRNDEYNWETFYYVPLLISKSDLIKLSKHKLISYYALTGEYSYMNHSELVQKNSRKKIQTGAEYVLSLD
ncbi:MAG: hypothetical protein JNJ41_02355 [Bacteroidia bacterium]|nr:hypothetical protein [Bacteroidia bacterium]